MTEQQTEIGARVIVRCDLNNGRYQGATATVIEQAKNHVVVVQLDRFTPGLDSPDGKLWLRPNEYERNPK